MEAQSDPTDPRAEAIRRHYEIETALAARLRRASKDERRHLYSELYDELFRLVPELLGKADPEGRAHDVALQVRVLSSFLHPDAVFLEVGAGDGALAREVARRVRKAYAVEASAEVTAGLDQPENLEILLTDSISLPLDAGSVDVAYSCHFLEHLHPDDADDHLAEMRRLLAPGGAYLCVTPNRIWGPHDVSRHFDDVPTGFHLREYTHAELARRLKRAGFERVGVLRGLDGPPVSVWPYVLVEEALDRLPPRIRRRLVPRLLGGRGRPPFRRLEQVKVLARAGAPDPATIR